MLALSLMMLTATALGGAEPVPAEAQVLTPELLAQVIAEAGGVGVWRTEQAKQRAWRLLMHTALNRHNNPRIPGLLDGFFRLDPSPPPEAVEMARAVMAADPKDDPTRGCMYALSAQDLDLLGIEREGDIVLPGNSVFSLNFYREWPTPGSDD